MDARDDLPQPQITKVQLLVYEGDIERDADGNITNKLQQTIEYDIEPEDVKAAKKEETE